MHNCTAMAVYRRRTLETWLVRAAREFPVVFVTGPRQSGKTTLLRHVARASAGYVSLDAPDVRESARSDPRGFLAGLARPVVLDEVQHAPELLSYVKSSVDTDRSRAGQFFVTGSQNLQLAAQVSETLAGRAAVFRLLGFSASEVAREPSRAPLWARARLGRAARALDPWATALRGGFPELVLGRGRDIGLWHASYVQTYLERDVRTLRQVGDLTLFQSFVRALAARSGGLLNLHDLSRELGVAVNTARAWVAVLEASYQIVIVRPFHANIGKRLVKTPKVYFTDPGTLCWLVGLRDTQHVRHGPMAGAIFETLVLSELLKAHWHRGEDARISFWRTSTGDEVDFVVETSAGLLPIEVKSTATPRPEMAKGIERFAAAVRNVRPGFVVHAGESRLPLGECAQALPWNEL